MRSWKYMVIVNRIIYSIFGEKTSELPTKTQYGGGINGYNLNKWKWQKEKQKRHNLLLYPTCSPNPQCKLTLASELLRRFFLISAAADVLRLLSLRTCPVSSSNSPSSASSSRWSSSCSGVCLMKERRRKALERRRDWSLLVRRSWDLSENVKS